MMIDTPKLTGLVAATHTPFAPDGSLNLAIVEKQAEHLLTHDVQAAFIGGTTGESHSLTLEERRRLTEHWTETARDTSLRVIVHVGGNCIEDCRTLAAQANRLGAFAIAALAPSYFKPRNVESLVDWCAAIAAAAPDTPFYYYDIPILTGVNLSMPDFLAQARPRIPTLRGLKFTNADLVSYQLCLRAADGAFDIAWGFDEMLLAALALGAVGAVGSSYNFAAPIYHRIMTHFSHGDLAAAREEQFKSVRLIQTLAGYGYMPAAKAVMGMLGVHVGPARAPSGNLDAQAVSRLRTDLERIGFFG